MKTNHESIVKLLILAIVLGSGMLISALAGGTVISTGDTILPDGSGGTQGSLVEYRNLTLNKNIGSTNLNLNGRYQMNCDFSDSSGIEYDLVPKSEIRNITLYNYKGQNVGEVKNNFNGNQIASSTYFYKVHLKDGNNFTVKSNILEGQMNVPKNVPADKIAVPKGKGGKHLMIFK